MNESDLHETRTRTILSCLGVSSRFRLVRILAVADRCVGELAEAVGLSQSCTTRHLQALERVGLVKGHREGRRVRFRLRAEAPGLGGLLGWALSGEGMEAVAARRDLRRDQAADPPITAEDHRLAQPAAAARTLDTVSRAAVAGSDSDGSSLPRDPGRRDPKPVVGGMRTRKPDDLEDYLL